ncbi:MAG: exodeoxyribonuclease VII large subunit [Bacillota bacterium]|jgi:exodeoxyribonuclease VII large subunit|nr:exodeoxyribonuclease VII large subunit [Bacillota bacterium]NLL59601.1 exodeoxyribonuclease VII large subunit [Tissierellia bacterium]
MKIKPIKVSVLNQYIKKYLMGNSILNNLRVEGEISNIRMSKTGYTYFSLCDESSCISCVAFFADTISKNGDKIIAEGELSVYEAKGTYQLIVRNIERVGLGKILLDLELLKEKLRSQGLFDRKRDLPPYPHKIGIITSKTGAAIKDILKTFESVKANLDITLYNALVQGERAKETIIEGLRYFNDRETEVVLISRGGGSFEDLNVFNDLDLAMEVYKSKAVVVTGIGHETDRTLTDYVADVYCHTPTAAAERIIRGYKDVEEKLTNLIFALKTGTSNVISTKKADLLSTKYILRSSLPLEDIYRAENMLKEHKNLIRNAAEKYINEYYIKIKIMGEKLTSYDYEKQLKRGFALVTDRAGNLVKIKNQVQAKDILQIRFADFKIEAETMDIKEV